MSKQDPAKIVGRIVGNLITNGLLLWAAIETSGPLRWALVSWLGFIAVVYLTVVAIKAAE